MHRRLPYAGSVPYPEATELLPVLLHTQVLRNLSRNLHVQDDHVRSQSNHSLPWPWQTHHISQYIPAFRVQPGSHPCKPYLYCTSGNRVSYEFHLLNQHKILPLLPFSSLHFCMFYLKSISHIFREKTDFTEF